ncbi:Alternative oxidase, mitochondrial [Cercospora beticola]|uniref:Alternative oxidase n=1 Tax=Cercospora beticola TaxID=122368 RepID=A0A2G5HTZ3_CERBT|nr:Alternative oxidase, mitochondrial [Cercospora beticola]PIA96011.1 Alternative oxidase, mitochondrial [Cercospora beticola]WPB07582.1 Alternative oxidase, mitochondrial precursor [Cercospora beticola]
MSCTRTYATHAFLTKPSAASVLRAINGSTATTAARPSFIGLQHQVATRNLSTSRTIQKKQSQDYFPEPDAPNIRETPPAWEHPVYTYEQMNQVQVARREVKTMSDRVALAFVRLLRWSLDTVSGYRKGAGQMTERQYMIRNIFLESVAGVPGMVAGMLRHLHSMRRLKRDNGWIETLLEESYNERMHLLTFLKMGEPGWFMKVAVLGAQGVFFNAFFVSYLISPKTCHRFVGHLEEEAVLTYTREIEDLDAGRLPQWEKMTAPDIAVKYWKMPADRRTMRDLLLYIRADESKHREVNHTLGNLDQKEDPNPYVSEFHDEETPHPVKDLRHQKPTGWEREEVIGKLGKPAHVELLKEA